MYSANHIVDVRCKTKPLSIVVTLELYSNLYVKIFLADFLSVDIGKCNERLCKQSRSRFKMKHAELRQEQNRMTVANATDVVLILTNSHHAYRPSCACVS